VAARSKALMIMDLSNTGVVGSNTASDMEVCPRCSVPCCPVYLEDLRFADLQSKESSPNV
jgi:hypothetical protein